MTKCLTYVSKPLALGELNAEILQLGLALSLESLTDRMYYLYIPFQCACEGEQIINIYRVFF
jgi:hypothetical protein